MATLMGEYHHSIDDKGRLIIPAKFREIIGSSFVVTRGLEGCLFLYSQLDWQKVVDQLNTLPFTKKDARKFSRFFLSGAINSEFDKQGRISITSSLKEYAGLTKDCVVIGVGDRLEIWSEDAWQKFFQESQEDFSDIAEHLFDGNLDL